jgi:hypothetical protein
VGGGDTGQREPQEGTYEYAARGDTAQARAGKSAWHLHDRHLRLEAIGRDVVGLIRIGRRCGSLVARCRGSLVARLRDRCSCSRLDRHHRTRGRPATPCSGVHELCSNVRCGEDKPKRLPWRCTRLPEKFHGKEGVDGSSPSEGSAKVLQATFSFRLYLHDSQRAVGMGPFLEPSGREARLDTDRRGRPALTREPLGTRRSPRVVLVLGWSGGFLNRLKARH